MGGLGFFFLPFPVFLISTGFHNAGDLPSEISLLFLLCILHLFFPIFLYHFSFSVLERNSGQLVLRVNECLQNSVCTHCRNLVLQCRKFLCFIYCSHIGFLRFPVIPTSHSVILGRLPCCFCLLSLAYAILVLQLWVICLHPHLYFEVVRYFIIVVGYIL